MTAQTAPVGANTIPVPIGGANSPIRDATIDGLLAYYGFLIKDALDAKLSEMGGPTTSSPVTDACPVANRFPWNHNGTFMRPKQGSQAILLPALYAWEKSSGGVREQTMVYDVLDRVIDVQYIFPQLNIPNAMMAREGLMTIVEQVFARGASRGRHPSFAIGSDALGTPLYRSLGLTEWIMTAGTPGFLEVVPDGSPGGKSAMSGAVQRGFPAYQATFKVSEKIFGVTSDANDQIADGKATIAILDGDNPQALDLMVGVLLPPDGSEDLP